MPEVRLQKAIADAGIASRRSAEGLIEAGRVRVDGEVASLGRRVDPERDRIEVDGRPLRPQPARIHLALAKPAGVTSTVSDRHAEMTVLDLVPPETRRAAGRLYPVGRLDRDSEGLLLLTNDGAWAQRVLHPRFGIEREYAVGLERPLRPEARTALESGIELEEGIARVEGLRDATGPETSSLLALMGEGTADLAWYRVVLTQGWKRQVRRMFAAVGAPVSRLVRVRVGVVRLHGLRSGQVRLLTRAEMAGLAALSASGDEPQASPEEDDLR